MSSSTKNSGHDRGFGDILAPHANGKSHGAGLQLLRVLVLLQSLSLLFVFVGWASGSGLQTNMQECDYLTHKKIIKWLIL